MKILRLYRRITTALFFVGFIIMVFSWNNAIAKQETVKLPGEKAKTVKEHPNYNHVTTRDSVRSVVDHPAFSGFGDYLLPWDNRTQQLDSNLSNVGSLLPYHSHVNPDIVVGAINFMIDEVNDGHTIFYSFYTDRQKQLDPTKQSAGLFFFRGESRGTFCCDLPRRRLCLCRVSS